MFTLITSSVKSFFYPPVKPSTYQRLESDEYSIHLPSSLNLLLIATRTAVVSACWAVFMHSKLKTSFKGTLLSGFLVTYGWTVLEYKWFIYAIRKAALQVFTKQSPVPYSTVTYMGEDPEVVKTLIRTPANLTKECSGIGGERKNLLKTLIGSGWSDYTWSKHNKAPFEVFKLLAPLSALDSSDLIQMVQKHPSCAIYTLEQDLVTLRNCNANDQSALWRSVKKIKVMRALVAKGFNIKNAARIKLGDGFNLEYSESHYILSDLCKLFSLGAEPPSSKENLPYISVERSNDRKKGTLATRQDTKLESLLWEKPNLDAVLKQAQEQAEPILIPDEWAWIGTRRPVVNIALSKRKFEIAREILNSRFWIVLIGSSCVAIKAFASLANRWGLSFSKGWPHMLLWSGVLSFNYYLFESKRASEHLREIALKAFKQPFPPCSIIRYVSYDLGLVQQLKNENLNKFDDHGHTLLDHLQGQSNPSFEIFKILADNVFEKKSPINVQFFFQVVRKGDVRFVEYLLSTHKIKSEEIDLGSLWHHWVGSPTIAELLMSYGFNLKTPNS